MASLGPSAMADIDFDAEPSSPPSGSQHTAEPITPGISVSALKESLAAAATAGKDAAAQEDGKAEAESTPGSSMVAALRDTWAAAATVTDIEPAAASTPADIPTGNLVAARKEEWSNAASSISTPQASTTPADVLTGSTLAARKEEWSNAASSATTPASYAAGEEAGPSNTLVSALKEEFANAAAATSQVQPGSSAFDITPPSNLVASLKEGWSSAADGAPPPMPGQPRSMPHAPGHATHHDVHQAPQPKLENIDPEVIKRASTTAGSLYRNGRFDDALPHFQKAVELNTRGKGPDHADTVRASYGNLVASDFILSPNLVLIGEQQG